MNFLAVAFTFPRCLDFSTKDCGSKFQNSSKFAYGHIGAGNDGWWYFRVKFNWSRPYMEMSDLGNHHLGFFPKGLTCDFGSKFLSVCMVKLDLEMTFEGVLEWSYCDLGHIWRFRAHWPLALPIIAEHMIGFLPPHVVVEQWGYYCGTW